MGDFKMPALGADMDAGTLIAWHVKPGDVVKRGDVVADVETDKGIVEVEIWESGVIASIAVAPGTKVPVGTVLATTRTNGAPSPVVVKPGGPAVAPVSPPTPAAQPVSVTSAGAREARVLASPAAKQLARERGVDVARVHGTGPHGSVTRADVEHASQDLAPAVPVTPPEAVQPTEPVPRGIDTAAMRRAIATAMARSKREIPHYYLSTEIEVGAAHAWLEGENAGRSVAERILFAAVLLKATASAVREVPEVNGFFVDDAFRPSKSVHVGVAISLRQGGLIAPAIHDVQAKTVAEVQAALRDLVGRVRAGRLRSSEMSDPTLTVTNLGDQGVESVFGVIYPPQVALVGFGRVVERPWAENGMLGIRRILTATLAADHRVSDGHRGAVFLSAIGRLLAKPEEL
jgi:pyruvate dehydrogenase E2 component (dihydrolipoamide acetyltransferase)